MTGYCPQCGNQICLCKDIAMQELVSTTETLFKGKTKEELDSEFQLYVSKLQNKYEYLKNKHKVCLEAIKYLYLTCENGSLVEKITSVVLKKQTDWLTIRASKKNKKG